MGKKPVRFPVNFHRTFLPERYLVASLMRYAANGMSGDYQHIHQQTGIPMGQSDGKVPAILDYARAMWLVTLDDSAPQGVKKPDLTPFGRVVLLEDANLSEPVTQWLAHFNMCASDGGAAAWYECFFAGRYSLGFRFSCEQLENLLVETFGRSKRPRTGPLARMYEEQSSFAGAGVLLREGGAIIRAVAPVSQEFIPAYTAWLLHLMEKYFPKKQQITVTELDRIAGWQSIPGWSDSQANEVLYAIQTKGAISVDRQMQPWVIHAREQSIDWWSRIYEEII